MLNRLSQADRISGASSVATVVATYLPWYRFDDGEQRVTANAFGSGFLGDAVFFAAAAALALLLMRHGVISVRRRIDDRAQLVCGAIALGATTLQLLIGINGSGAFRHVTIGIAVALLAGAGMLVGGYLQQQESGPMRTAPGRR
jgi:hypothetical protein